MRKPPFLALCAALLAASLGADTPTRERLSKYFAGWYSVCPGTSVTVAEAPEFVIPGYVAYKVERTCEAKNRNEVNIALVDPARDAVFVGEVFYSGDRHDQPFVAATDLPVIESALSDSFGLPVSVKVEPGAARGSLIPIRATIREAPFAMAGSAGFVSQDGAALLLGEFHPLGMAPERWREQLLAESAGVSTGKGSSPVTAFIDFQCERCRIRTPQVREFLQAHGGTMEIRFLPLVKVHNWAFAAAESAAALSTVSPALYAKYEDAIFPRAGSMTEDAARELAVDVAESAGVRKAFDAEIASGRARNRVVRDMELAMRLQLNGTPVFFYKGVYLTSEPSLVENYIQSRQGGASGSPDKGVPR